MVTSLDIIAGFTGFSWAAGLDSIADIRKRSYKNFDPVVYRQKLDAENWSEIYEITDVDLANDFIESRIVKFLDEMCPFKTVQFRKDCKTWLTDETKTKMRLRDDMREQARNSGNQDKWTGI